MIKKTQKIFLVLSISLIFLLQLVSADLIVPTPTPMWPPIHIILLFLTIDVVFNFFVAAGFFALFKKNILAEKIPTYFIAVLIITIIGMIISFALKPILGFEDYILNLIDRGILSIGQIIVFPFIFSWFRLSDKKTALKVGVATVILGFIIGSIIALFYIGGAPVTPIGAPG